MPHPVRSGALLPFLFLLPGLLADDPKPQFTIESRPEPERPYRLFVGVDVKVLHEEDFTRVADFGHNRALLDRPDGLELPIDKIGAIRFDHTPKLGTRPVTISDIRSERAYSQGNPRWEWMMAQSAVQGQVQDQLSVMEREISRASSMPETSAFTTPDGSTVEASNPLADAINNYTSFAHQNAKLADSAYYAQKAEEEGGDDAFDAIVVEATLSSPQPIADAYAVGIARITTPAEGQRDLVFFDEVGDLGPQSRTVKIRKEGLPPGFEVVKVDLHLYRQGQELVSNRSEKQFALSRDEALEYLTLERLSRHRGETLPPEPVWALAPAALLAARDPAAFDQPLTIQVDAKGHFVKLADETAVAPPLAALAAQLLFLPALADGEAVPGTVTLNLTDYFR